MINVAAPFQKYLFILAALLLTTTTGTALADTPQSKPNAELPGEKAVVASREAAVPEKPESSYALREQQSQQQAEFTGGGAGLYLSGTGIVVLLIVLIILL